MKHLLIVSLLGACLVAPAFASKELAQSKNCLGCHAVDKKMVGPALKDVAAKYAGDKAAPSMLATKIKAGGSGVWGAIPMPANPQVKDADAKKLANWILGLK